MGEIQKQRNDKGAIYGFFSNQQSKLSECTDERSVLRGRKHYIGSVELVLGFKRGRVKGRPQGFRILLCGTDLKRGKGTDDEDSDSTMSQYKDMYLDQVIELVADELVDDLGESTTQQLYEQMKRNYNITSASESTDLSD
jgi:hypothetical protein